MFIQIVLLFIISIVYFFGIAPDMTWMGLAGDAPDYVAASVMNEQAGLAGYPLVIGIGWIFQQIFYRGFNLNPFWVMGLVSAISTVVTCGYIYSFIKLYSPKSSLPSIIGTLAYGGALLVWSQSIIPEVYSMTVMLMVMGIYYLIKAYREDRPKLLYVSSLVFGLSFCTHPLAYFAFIPAMVYLWKVKLKNKPSILKLGLVFTLGTIPWLQWVLANPNQTYPAFSGEKINWIFQSLGIVGGMPVIPLDFLIIRLEDFFSLLGLGLCIVLPFFILNIVTLYKVEKGTVYLLSTIAILPIILYLTSIPPQWITYVVPAIAFLSMLGGVCAVEFLDKYNLKSSLVVASVCGLFLLGMNLWFYDIGRSVDTTPTTARQIYEKFQDLPENTIVYTHTWGHLSLLIDSYNRLELPDISINKVDGTVSNTVRESRTYASGITIMGKHEDKFYGGPAEVIEGIEADIDNIVRLNPDWEVYVVYLKDRKNVEFDLIPASDYRHILNDIPVFSRITSGGVGIQ